MEKFDITFVQGQTKINADFLNWVTSTLNELVDKEQGESTWKPYVASVQNADNAEFVAAYLDADDKVLYGVRTDGTIYAPNIDSDTTNQGYLGAVVSTAIAYMESHNRPQTELINS